jgi:GNAT superfamily N-acetyltransferase
MSVVFRPMKPEDAQPVRKLIMKFLKETYADGADFPATLENSAAFTAYALAGAAEGDPCIVADEDGKLVGFIIARGVTMPGMTMRYKTLRSWGTYVLPEYRSKGYGISMLVIVGRMAKWAGYERFVGLTRGNNYEEHALYVANKVPGMQIVGRVLMIDMTRKAVHNKPAEESAA